MVARELSEVIGLDDNESELFFVMEEYREKSRVRFSLGDLHDRNDLIHKKGGDVILCAALKHILVLRGVGYAARDRSNCTLMRSRRSKIKTWHRRAIATLSFSMRRRYGDG